MTKNKEEAQRLLQKALDLLESKRIRDWATNPHNYPLWIQIAESVIAEKTRCVDPDWFAAYIVATAIGA